MVVLYLSSGWYPVIGLLKNITLCEYFPWGYMKALVFQRKLHKTDELKDFIRHEIATITEAMTWRTLQMFRVRNQCESSGGKSEGGFMNVLQVMASIWVI